MTDNQIIAQTPTLATNEESIKIEKNSRGINWEFRMYGLDVEQARKKIIEINDMVKSLGVLKK